MLGLCPLWVQGVEKPYVGLLVCVFGSCELVMQNLAWSVAVLGVATAAAWRPMVRPLLIRARRDAWRQQLDRYAFRRAR